MAKCVLDWVDHNQTRSKLKTALSKLIPFRSVKPGIEKFEFTFLIQMKRVIRNVSLEREIIEQHDLEADENQIKSVLKHCKTLLIFDGYDEYKKGTNSAIDAAISSKRGNSFVLITSRPDYMTEADKKKMSGEIQIRGLSKQNIQMYLKRYIGHDKSESLMKAAEKSGIHELLRTPIIALMLSILYLEMDSLPKTQTKIICGIIKMYIKRAKEKGVELPPEDDMMYILGELSWEALQRKIHQLLFKKVSNPLFCWKLFLLVFEFKNQGGSARRITGKLEKHKNLNFSSTTFSTVFKICLYSGCFNSSVHEHKIF